MRKNTVLIVIVVGLGLVAATAHAGGPNAALATGDLFIGLLDIGELTCIGGEPVPDAFPPCTPDTRHVIWRHHTGILMMANLTGEAAPFVPATVQTDGNCNLSEVWEGPCWGTFEAVWLGGTWAGTYSGTLDFIGFAGDLKFVGHGTGGEIDGMQMKIEAESGPTGDPTAPMPFVVRVQPVDD